MSDTRFATDEALADALKRCDLGVFPDDIAQFVRDLVAELKARKEQWQRDVDGLQKSVLEVTQTNQALIAALDKEKARQEAANCDKLTADLAACATSLAAANSHIAVLTEACKLARTLLDQQEKDATDTSRAQVRSQLATALAA